MLRALNLESTMSFSGGPFLYFTGFPSPADLVTGHPGTQFKCFPAVFREDRFATPPAIFGIKVAEDDLVVIFELESLEGTQGFGITESTGQDVRVCSDMQVVSGFPHLLFRYVHRVDEGRVDLPVKKCGRGIRIYQIGEEKPFYERSHLSRHYPEVNRRTKDEGIRFASLLQEPV